MRGDILVTKTNGHTVVALSNGSKCEGIIQPKTYALGEKIRVEGKALGVQIITWYDETTEWSYNSKTNEVDIQNVDVKDSEANENEADMFLGIADGYDVSIEKETADAWHILCKKSKDNTDKDDPKTINLVIAKRTYYPVSLKAKVSGTSVTLRDVSFGVKESQVTFNPKDYPTAKIVDKRK